MVIWKVFQSLGLKTELLPLLDSTPLDEMDEYEYERDAEAYEDDPWSFPEFFDYGDEEGDFDCPFCRPEFPSFEAWQEARHRVDRIGTKLHALKFCESGEEEEYIRACKEVVSLPSHLRLLHSFCRSTL